MSRLLDDDETDRQLADLPHWRRDGNQLCCTLEATDFATAIAIVDRVADEAEQMDHHPDIDIRWRTLTFVLSTHSAGGITQLDLELAHRISSIAVAQGLR
jgi:4a-hydroxytetrahydrobiopterin dehydratase